LRFISFAFQLRHPTLPHLQTLEKHSHKFYREFDRAREIAIMSNYGQSGGDGYGNDQSGGGFGGNQGDSYGTDQSGGGFGGNQGAATDSYGSDQSGGGFGGQDNLAQDQSQEKTARRREDEAGLGGLAAAGYAAYEGHEVNADPANAGRHRLEEEVAGGGAALGAGGALYERHEKKDDEQQVADDGGAKKSSWF
jgi:hypothetical protein